MKRIILLFLFPLTLFAQSAIVTKANKGRLGDQFTTVAHALYFSHIHDLPLYIEPFHHSDLFFLSQLYPSSHELPDTFDSVVKTENHSDINREETNTLYQVPYILDNYMLSEKGHPFMTPDYTDPEYQNLLREALKPIKEIQKVTPPEGRVSVAIHLRTGEGYDPGRVREAFSYKFTSKKSCLKMLNWLKKNYLSGEKLYVHIFSDVKDPKRVLTWFQRRGPKNVEWGITEDNKTLESLLSDFYSMASFDYLIRPTSNFSIMAQIIGNHKRVVFSTKAHYEKKYDCVFVDEFISLTPEEFYKSYFNPN